MPDGRIEADGVYRLGVSYSKPYLPIWSSITLLPYLELSGRYTIIRNLKSGLGEGFGDFKDKAFDVKLRLAKESRNWPSLALGAQDFTGTGLFSAQYAAITRHFRNADYTVGYGRDRIDGFFGGVRQQASWNRNIYFVAEYDAYRYSKDFRASDSGASKRNGGWTYGVEVKKGWLGAQLSNQDGDLGITAYVSIPLMDREYIPKLEEPAPYTKKQRRASIETWEADTSYAARMAAQLHEEDFKNVKLELSQQVLSVSLSNARISKIGRAVGRAARIVLALGPDDIRRIFVTYTNHGLPTVRYEFTDISQLKRYFEGLISPQQLAHYVNISYVDPVQAASFPVSTLTISPADFSVIDASLQRTEDGSFLGFRSSNKDLTSFSLNPFNLDLFFNDANGAARYDFFATADYKKQLANALFFESSARLTLAEDVSEVSQASNSELPHVRSDIGQYLKGDRFRIAKLLLNQYLQPAERVYARLSAGYYEMMFAGVGGQVMFLPEKGNWAADFSVDWLRQRDTRGGFGFRDYETVTALGAFHYRMPALGLTSTVRTGRFLAKDRGVRFELKRRFRSGITFGAWVTFTDGDDTQPPGSPGSPYYDKGIFASIPLGSMLTRDTQARSNFSLAPWTRDVGQMVASPGDLYALFERTLLLDTRDSDVMSDFGQ